ncbi:MAG: hypothetical protein ACQEXQ_08815 [Bacillota bacterium]
MMVCERDWDAIREERAQQQYEKDMACLKMLYQQAESTSDICKMNIYQSLMNDL